MAAHHICRFFLRFCYYPLEIKHLFSVTASMTRPKQGFLKMSGWFTIFLFVHSSAKVEVANLLEHREHRIFEQNFLYNF